MNDPKIEQWVARELGRMRKPDDLIVTVCERTGLKWDAAKDLIHQVQQREAGGIVDHKRRIALFYAIPTFFIGLYFLVCSTYGIATRSLVVVGTNIPHPLMYFFFVVSVSMVGGSIYGMFRIKK